MNNQNNAAQAAERDPLSDQFVNAVIRQHGYDCPEAVIARLWQWIGLNGSENGVTLLMYEAHKALVKLRAPVADERQGDIAAALQDSAYCAGLQRGFELGNHNDNDGLRRALESRDGYVKTIKDARAALASAPVADERVVANAQAAFEAWSEGTNQGYDLTRMNSGKLATYESDLTEHAWRGYCHAALASAPVAGEAQKPVAWRYQTPTGWHATTDAQKAMRVRDHHSIESLYAAPQASEAVREVSGVTLDGCLETLFRVGEHLGIDYAESRKQPGAPSDVYIKAIEDRVSQARDTALEEAATLMDQTSRGTGATLIRAALSAQPGAQMPHPKQHNDGGAVYG